LQLFPDALSNIGPVLQHGCPVFHGTSAPRDLCGPGFCNSLVRRVTVRFIETAEHLVSQVRTLLPRQLPGICNQLIEGRHAVL